MKPQLLLILALSLAFVMAADDKETRKARDTAVDTEKRVVHGEEALPYNKYPFMGMLLYGGTDPSLWFDCGCSLIDPHWAITAAHCIYWEYNESYHPGFDDAYHYVVLGGHNNQLSSEEGRIIRKVDKWWMHPDFEQGEDTDIELYYDVTLLHLEEPVYDVAPIPLVTDNSSPLYKDTTKLHVAGWGKILDEEPGTYPGDLQETVVMGISTKSCNKYEVYHGYIESTQTCAGYPGGGRDTCYYDSGGPLFYIHPATGAFTLVGLTSTGKGCANPNSPGIYTRLGPMLSWIKNTMKKKPNNCVCAESFLGNDACELMCMTEECDWDGGDCDPCARGCTWDLLKNDVCDSACNNRKCNYDNTLCSTCSTGCKNALLKNGVCDLACNTSACEYDAGACLPCALVCESSKLGDGVCDAECNIKACNFDSGDCSECSAGCLRSSVGNGECNEECNVPACNHDGGDCDYCSHGCHASMVGDGNCDTACITPDCDYDGGDCTVPSGFCEMWCPKQWLGDGQCDEGCNNPECNHDCGDCGGTYNIHACHLS